MPAVGMCVFNGREDIDLNIKIRHYYDEHSRGSAGVATVLIFRTA
jgi:hypothetical protein